MAYHVGLSVRPNRSFMQFDELHFKCYKPEEVNNISVLEITQANTFDEAGFPVKCGLYDPVLGSDGGGHCETCGLEGFNCPGHFGHIQLTVPVFNPLFYGFTFNMMKGTCIHCHRFTFDTNSIASKVIIAKLRSLDFGFPELLDRIESILKAKCEKADELLRDRIDIIGEEIFLQRIDNFIAEMCGMANFEELRERFKDNVPFKNNVTERNTLVKSFIRESLNKRKSRCPRCKQPNGELRNDSGRTFLLDFSKKSTSQQRKHEGDRLGEAKLNKLIAESKGNHTNFEADRPDLVGFMSMEIEEEGEFKKFEPKLMKGNASMVSNNALIDPLSISDQLLADQLRQVIDGKCDKLAWRAAEVREHLRLVWQREYVLISHLFPFFNETCFTSSTNNSEKIVQRRLPIDSLFIETIIVEPSRYRPIRFFKGERYEHPTTVNLRKVLEADQLLTLIKLHMETENGNKQQGMKLAQLGFMAKELIESRIMGKTLNEKLHNAYQELQMRANALFDRAANRVDGKGAQPGLKQVLEKKEGLFRMHMMGKRVNFACRSVITPDPYLDVDEIGVPELFAHRLTFPEPVSFLNQQHLKQLVRKGPDQHPGANFIEFSGILGKPPSRVKIPRGKGAAARERGYLSTKLRLGDINNAHAMPDYVLRHLQNGDKLLMNRQPSLHKPSIMGHRARVLRGQKALRMNYAPCKAYNADFDGDEMNGHFIQNRIAQCEAIELTNVGNNYLVPKDGTPILGLIQDHIVAGVLMTIRGRFFNKEDFMHLLLAAFAQTEQRLSIPLPSIMRPVKLWSGKQVISAILQNCCPHDRALINLEGKAKTGLACWKSSGQSIGMDMSESLVIFREGELLSGVLDKAHYGATQFGLIHCCYELYGPQVAVKILSCFSRVFTTYLQFHGFSLGVADILVTRRADHDRRKTIRELRKCGEEVVQKTFGTSGKNDEEMRNALATAYNHPNGDRSMIELYDYNMKQNMSKFTEQINSYCVPYGLIREFPNNSLQLMIQSGAKGSLVNSIQISCALGQIELEGQRPPRSVTGRSLPSFHCFDHTPRAGGFIDQRFLTGVNCQELFFHTMAGREGLIDTAVKTSRSGYLQRCIIKHLEGLTVHYDNTVRDHDSSVVQFRYGEDGMDVGRVSFLDPKHFPFLYQNVQTLKHQVIPPNTTSENEVERWHLGETEKQFRRISKFKRRTMRKRMNQDNQEFVIAKANKGYRDSAFLEFCRHRESNQLKQTLVSEWETMSNEKKAEFIQSHSKAPTPVDVKFHPSTHLGALPEKKLELLEEFLKEHLSLDDRDEFKKAFKWKGMRALVDPGESVGLLAAQSIGEPSTQMTLNTFHFAGRGEMNVTLGIPRLREILMTQSKHISTPIAEVCFYSDVPKEQIERIKSELNPIMLRQVIQSFVLEERIHTNQNGTYLREYSLHIDLLRNDQRDPVARHLKRRKILREMEERFGKSVASALAKRYKEVKEYQQIQHRKLKSNNVEALEDLSTTKARQEEELESDEEEAAGGVNSRETDAHEERLNKRHLDYAADYEGEEQDRNEAGMEDADKGDDIVELGQADEDETTDSEAEQSLGANDLVENVEERRYSVKEVDVDRIKLALDSHSIIADYEYDVRGERWCNFKFHMPLPNKNCIDALAVVEREIDAFVVSSVAGIEKSIVREEQRKGRHTYILQTQGINLQAFYLRSKFLDINSVYSNDIDFMLRNFGIEAAAHTIAKEMNNVFGVYGIEVNPRHLSLTSDYMTFTGEVQPFSRGAMANSASALQKITFETTIAFMRDALISGQFDTLFSPSARLVTGQMVRCGTGAFDLLNVANYILDRARNAKTTTIQSKIMKMRNERRERKQKFNL